VKPHFVLAHDYITQRGGAERVVLELFHALSPEYISTALYNERDTFPDFHSLDVRASWLNWVKFFRNDPRRALPFLASAWSFKKKVDAAAVICSSSGWSHALPVTARTCKIVYCHNPARWLYQPDDYLLGKPRWLGRVLFILRTLLIEWDQKAAATVDCYIANSTSVADRIREIYKREPLILFPPIGVNAAGSMEPILGIDGSFYLAVGRQRGYKGLDVLIDAFRYLPDEKLLIAGSKGLENCPPNVTGLGFVSDAQLRWLYANARALVSVSREDFGLTPIEANAFGTPALLLRAGGFLDTLVEGLNGNFIEKADVASIVDAVRAFPVSWDSDAIRLHATRFSPNKFAEQIREIVIGQITQKRGQ